MSASNKSDAHGALAATARIDDDAARKLAAWYIYQSISGSAELIESFRTADPDSPALKELRGKTEATLYLNNAAEQTKAFFAKSAAHDRRRRSRPGERLDEGRQTLPPLAAHRLCLARP